MPTTKLPSPDGPAKKTHRPYTEEEVRLVTEMLSRPEINGNVAQAVTMLKVEQPATDWTYSRVYNLVKGNRYTEAFYPARNPEDKMPDDADIIDREQELLTPIERRELAAMAAQEKKLSARDWVQLGLDDKQAERMLSMERFAQQPLKSMIATTQGSMMFALGILLQNFEETAKRIRSGELPEEVDGKGVPRPAIDVERDWHKVMIDYSKELRAIGDQVNRSNALMAKVDQIRADMKDGKKGGKPGFRPMVIAKPGSQVAIVNAASETRGPNVPSA